MPAVAYATAMDEDDQIKRQREQAEDYAMQRFDYDWDNLLSEECQPWQREAVELAFRMGFFEGIGYAGQMLGQHLDGDPDEDRS